MPRIALPSLDLSRGSISHDKLKKIEIKAQRLCRTSNQTSVGKVNMEVIG